MPEIWLKVNRRPFFAALSAFVPLIVSCGFMAARGSSLAGLAIVFLLVCIVTIAWLCFGKNPLTYRDGRLLVRTGKGVVSVPIEFVEGFLLGQGPSYLPGKRASRLDTSTLVVRLAERATQWEFVPMHSMLGSWCHHYITFRGTYCERLSVDLVNRLNARLYEAQQAVHANEKAMA
jgi:hypothetical protein